MEDGGLNGQRSEGWKAGLAQELAVDAQAPGAWAWTLLVGRCAGSVALGAAKGTLLVALCLQAYTMGMQAWEESKASESIGAMKSEQDWLVGQGLARERRIGVVGDGYLPHNGSMEGRVAHMAQANEFVPGWDATGMIRLMDLGAQKLGMPSMVGKRSAISVADPSSKSTFELDMVYRHEEGHARASDLGLDASAPDAWPKEVSEALLPLINGSRSLLMNDWRLVWLRSTRDEAFADAFACLSKARAEPGAMSACAVQVHERRIFPKGKIPETISSVMAAGSDHAVEMASYLVGQLSQKDVARLDSAGLDQLSGKIADASMAWALARQAPHLEFFSDAYSKWQAEMAFGKPAAQAWNAWCAQNLAAEPEAAFGAFHWLVSGIEFKAMGLTKGKASKDWRYDGFGGVARLSWLGDKSSAPEAAAASDAREEREEREEPSTGSKPGKPTDNKGGAVKHDGRPPEASDDKKDWSSKKMGALEALASISDRAKSAAFSGAVWTHVEMLKAAGLPSQVAKNRLDKEFDLVADPSKPRKMR